MPFNSINYNKNRRKQWNGVGHSLHYLGKNSETGHALPPGQTMLGKRFMGKPKGFILLITNCSISCSVKKYACFPFGHLLPQT